MPFRVFLQEAWRNKSISRTMMNLRLHSSASLQGITLDLGGGKCPSYYRFLGHQSPPREVIRVDLVSSNCPSLIASLEDNLPFQDDSVDQVLLLNVLEHIYHHRRLLNEVSRVLRKDGQLLLWVPFLAGVHPDPMDYYRYTNAALSRLFDESAFAQHEIGSYGGLFLVIADHVRPLVPTRLLRLLLTMVALLANELLDRLAPNYNSQFVLGYLAQAQK